MIHSFLATSRANRAALLKRRSVPGPSGDPQRHATSRANRAALLKLQGRTLAVAGDLSATSRANRAALLKQVPYDFTVMFQGQRDKPRQSRGPIETWFRYHRRLAICWRCDKPRQSRGPIETRLVA